MNQQVGNFPGVTVDKTIGRFKAGELNIDAIDLPGTYSLYPKRMDEWVSYRVVIGDDESFRPNLVVAVVDASNLKRNLLLATQLIDLSVPVVIALTMMDLARKKGIQIDIPALERELGVPVVAVNPRKNKGIIELKKMIQSWHKQPIKTVSRSFIDSETLAPAAIRETQALFPEAGDYKAIHYLINHESLSIPHQKNIESIEIAHQFNPTKTQAEEILLRYARIREVMQTSVSEPDPLKKKMVTERLDSLFLHRRWGNFILLAVLFLLFQSVYWLAKYPMDWIEGWFGMASGWLGTQLPNFILGMTNRFTYKNFDMSFLLYYRNGTMYNNAMLGGTMADYTGSRYNHVVMNYWTKNNPTNDFYGPGVPQPYRGARNYEVASFLRLSDITLGYNVPASVLKKKIERIRIYGQIINPGVWSKYNGLDPEYNSSTYIDDVPTITYAVGLNIGF